MNRSVALYLLFAGIVVVGYGFALAADKNGVSPQVISLPSGPGSIQGLGESFQPQLNSGSGSFSVPIQLPSGPTGFAPDLSLDYHTGQGNGCVGIGWKLSGASMISRNMDRGLPLYVDGPNGIDDDFDGTVDNPEEIDRFSGVSLEELVPLADGSLRSETEGSFVRYQRVGAGWELREKDGTVHEFGMNGAARLENNGRAFAWLLERTRDLNGNAAEYQYMSDAGSPGQKYLREVRWAQPGAFYAAVLSYDASRPDVHTDFRSGFEIRTSLRLARIDVIAQGIPASPLSLVGDFNGDGQPDSLIRRYEFEYEPKGAVSRLSRVTLKGADAVISLPPISFQYTDWIPPDDVSLSFTLSTGDPSVALNSDDVELIDMNQDGLPDLLHASQASHRIHLNLGMNKSGRLEWDTVGSLVGNAPGLNLGSTAVHLADHSADGESDLIHKVNSSTFQCFLNSGQRSWLTPVTLGNTDTWPRWPFENSDSRTLDADHNRLHDILATGANSYRLWMMMPGGRYGREVALPVLSDGTQGFTFEDPGARIADVNGDRISDLAWVQSTRVVYWASCGRGNFDGPIFLPLSGSLLASEIPRVDLADLNGDGLADLVIVRPAASPNGIHYLLNRGVAGFDVRRTILGLPSPVVGDATRCADMNGNGSVDFLISNSARPAGTRVQFLDLVPGIRPNLLTRIENGLGMVTTLDYETSVEQMVKARDAGNPWELTMPMSVPVVARITESDSRGTDYVREITYRDPFHDSEKQEFRGFTRTQVRDIGDDSIPTKVIQYVFDSGVAALCRKGMVLSQEVTDTNGSRFEQVENTVQHRILDSSADGRQVCYAFNEATDTFVFEQTDNPIQLRSEYQFDDFGNVLNENMLGIVGEDGDEQFVEKAYFYEPTIWLMDRMSRSTVRDRNGTKVAEDLFSYDTRGNMLEHRRWLDVGDRFILAVSNEYDAFGNVIHMTDANGHSRSAVYDGVLHRFPIAEIIHLQNYDLTMTAAYDMALETVVSSVDFAGAQAEYRYDSLARLIELQRPAGARTTYQYILGNPLSHIATRVRETLENEGTFDSFDYFDGQGRKLGSKIEAEDGQWRFVGAVTFNRRKMERTNWNAYFTATPDYEIPDPVKPHHALFYDVQGRAVRTINPDGTESRTAFEPLVQHRFDENDVAGAATPTSQRSDGLNRLVEVVERNGPEEYHTRYKWNTLGELVETLDSQGNMKSLIYDSLRRMVSMNDPDRGVATFEYDDVGNLLRTTDARGQSTILAYDAANRLVAENQLDQGGGPGDPIDVQWVYDVPTQNVDCGDGTSATATFTSARLAAVIDSSGEEHRSYDARGNHQWTVKRIRDPQLGVLTSYRTSFAYDVMDRLVDVYYPDNDHCRYTYNSASFPERIDGGPGGQVFIAATSYEANAKTAQVTYGNAVTTTNDYDGRERLTRVRTISPIAGDLIHYSYDHDPTSNIVGINDLRPLNGPHGVPADSPRRNSQRFEYDDLYRLKRVRYTPTSPDEATLGTITYSYDALGNMLSQTSDNPKAHLGAMTYGGGRFGRLGRSPGDPPGPHALTATEIGGVHDYDANGNMATVDGATLTWDFRDRLVRFQQGKVDARYTYDHSNRRVAKLVNEQGRSDQTIYVNQYFEYRPNRAPVKYVIGGTTRLAQVTDTLDPLRPRLQRIWLFEGFNLVTVAVRTLQSVGELFGPGSRVYEWTGKEYRELNADGFLPVGNALWVEVPGPRVVAALGMYEPAADAVVVPAGQTLLAWPRLEPLVPNQHLLSVDARFQAHDPQRLHWLLKDPLLPANVADAIQSFDSASAMWLTAPAQTQLLPGANEDRGTIFYHNDHLESSSVISDRHGALVQEVANFPFGEERHSHEPGAAFRQPYGFTGKEQDAESGLHYFEARYLVARLGRFASVDSKYASPDSLSGDELSAYLAQPQDLNLYAYSRNNPTRFIDPTGMSPWDWIVETAEANVDFMMGVGKDIQDFRSKNEFIIGRDGWDDLDVGRSLKVAQGTVEVVGGALACAPTAGAGCVMAAHGVDVLISAAQDNDRTYTARAITAVTGSETAGDVGDIIAGVGVGGAGIAVKAVAVGVSKKLPGAAVNAFSTTAKVTNATAKAQTGAAAATAAKATPRMQTLSGVRPFKAETAGAGYAKRVQSTNLRNTYSNVVEPATAGQVHLQQKLNVRVLKQQWNAPAKTPKQ